MIAPGADESGSRARFLVRLGGMVHATVDNSGPRPRRRAPRLARASRFTLSAAQEATPAAADCPATTAEENKEVVTQFLEAVSAGDDAAAADLSAEGITYHSPSKGERGGDAEGFLRGQRASFPDATMTVDLLVAEGDTSPRTSPGAGRCRERPTKSPART
jgi:hypothetical protein